MLNLAKLAGKTPKISRHFKQEVTASRKRVFATNGSKIAPSHREIAYFYLINVGRIVLHYGQNLHPLLDSVLEVYHKPEDFYIAKQWGIRMDEWMSYRRTVLESQMLEEMPIIG